MQVSNATLTLLGLYQYGLVNNINMFDNLKLPESLDHETCVNNILHNCADFEVLYPDFEFMCQAIEMFSTKWQRTIEKWVEVQAEEYKPLANYDRYEDWSDSMNQSTSEVNSMQDSNSTNSSENISAYNSDIQRPNTSAAQISRNVGLSSRNGKNDNLSKHEGHVWGNIGVMTTQAIYKEQWDVVKINIYDSIMELFAREFLIPFTY